MQPTIEIESFIERINALPAGPGVSLDAALQPSLDDEAELRKLFATDKKNTRLSYPYVGLVDVFDAPATIRTSRARIVEGKEDLSAKYVMPVTSNRRAEGAPSTVIDLEEFKKNWSIFTEGSLSQLIDWNNVIAAGGSVLACLTPLSEADKTSKRAIRKFYHSNAYPTSDVDLFLWGMTPKQAEVKIKEIYEAVRDSVPWDVTCIRTKHTVSIHSQYPYRSVQIVLRLYQSPAEILAGFDIDAPCCAYDGNRVWANPRAVVAMMRQCNTVDMTRRSPSYEVRLAKYSQRSFEIYVPSLERSKIDPTIYERSIARMEGLARLLALEKLADENMRNTFLEGRRQLRGRILANVLVRQRNRRMRRQYKGDLKGETNSGVVEMNDYDVASLHLPYGPGWDARRIDKLVYQTDLGMNSTFNPKNKGRRLHRHPAFFGTIEECIEDCCGNCPTPIDDDEKKLQAEEDEAYIRGRIQFIEENPGRQSITGSFKPIDVGEWSEQVYIKPSQALFTAIAAHDRATVQRLLSEGVDINQRDHVGRTTLHVAIFSKATDIALDLIDAGARITARIADGRAPLHLAAQFDQVKVIRKLLEKNAHNIKEAEAKNPMEKDESMDSQVAVERPSSEDDWSSHDDEDVMMSDADEEDNEDEDEGEDGDEDESSESKEKSDADRDAEEAVQENLDAEDQPDIIDVNEFDWDFGFSALSYAILFASVPTIDALLASGADFKLASKATNGQTPLHPLSLTILREDEDEACKVAKCLLKAGATSSTANDFMSTIFHAAVSAGRMKLVETMLHCDPHAATVIDFPAFQGQNVVFPIVTAINRKHYGIVALLLTHDAKLELDERDISRAQEAASPNIARQLNPYGGDHFTNYLQLAYQPLEVAVKNHDDLSKLLISLGASVDIGLLQSLSAYSDVSNRRTIKEWVDKAILSLEKQIKDRKTVKKEEVADTPVAEPADEVKAEGWKGFYKKYLEFGMNANPKAQGMIDNRHQARIDKENCERMEDIRDFLVEIQSLLHAKGAKGWTELYPAIETQATVEGNVTVSNQFNAFRASRRGMILNIEAPESKNTSSMYMLLTNNGPYNLQPVAQHLISAYDELFEACYAGDNARIEKLCLPVEGQDSGGPSPLNISVRQIDASTGQLHGHTPLSAAIAGRRWSTAKLVLAIATAQYHPADDEDKIKFRVDVNLDDDSDNESCASDDSDMTVEQQEIKFVDIATRPSAVRCDTHPRKMLVEVAVRWTRPPGSDGPAAGMAAPLSKAIQEHDLDAFVHIADLYQSIALSIQTDIDVLFGRQGDTLDTVLAHDQVDILDEYIRRTGDGLDIALVKKSSVETAEELPAATNDANKMYLGLNVHGKKRMDLVQKNDPDATPAAGQEKKLVPLLWSAIRLGAKGVIKYLKTNKPLSAYKTYSTSTSAHGGEKARWIRRFLFDESGTEASLSMYDAEERLAGWLGWTVNSLGESPLTAAIIGNHFKTIKLLEKLEPELMAQALSTKIKFVGINMLSFALQNGCNIKIIDYLLAKNLSAEERDSNRGWNIYHHICDRNNKVLLDHFLQKLSREVNEELLKQQSKRRFNTPLHVAVKKGHVDLVSTILSYLSSAPTATATLLRMRDVDGQTPLHCAVRRNFARITKAILDASKSIPGTSSTTLQTDLLNTEDSIGLTPLEIARLKELTHRVSSFAQTQNAHYYGPAVIQHSAEAEVEPRRVDLAANGLGRTERGLEDVKGLLERLETELQGGKRKRRLDVGVVRTWVAEMEKLVERAREREKRRVEEEREERERERLELEEEKKKQAQMQKPMKKKNTDEEVVAPPIRVPAPQTEHADLTATYRHLQDAAKLLLSIDAGVPTPPSSRHLIHLLDVQRSVHATLARANGEDRTQAEDYRHQLHVHNRNHMGLHHQGMGQFGGRRSMGGMPPRRQIRAKSSALKRMQNLGLEREDVEAEAEKEKEKEERKERRLSMVFQYIALGPDDY